jgi:hypothetical protein
VEARRQGQRLDEADVGEGDTSPEATPVARATHTRFITLSFVTP